eukprot:14491879-Ditylum_brightwellii.AAC.1
MGFALKYVTADFDMKFIGGAMKEFFAKKEQLWKAPPMSPTTEQSSRETLVHTCKNDMQLDQLCPAAIIILVCCT